MRHYLFQRRKNAIILFLALIALIVLAIILRPLLPFGQSQPVSHRGRQGDYFPIPAAALVRPLGVIPDNPATQTNNPQDPKDKYVAGRGIPLGGLGAGSFMYNQSGTFGPWEFRTGLHEERILNSAAFHVREQLAGGTASVLTLATDHPLGKLLSAWRTLQPGDGTYAALYPFGWTTYTPFASDISMRFWSPIVAEDDQHSSLPVAYFDVRLANHTGKDDNLSVMFTFPNAPLCISGPRSCTRVGLTNHVQTSGNGITGVTMSASDPSNVTDAQNTEWTIATRAQPGMNVSYTTSWDDGTDGSAIYNYFTNNGKLNDGVLEPSNSASAIAVSLLLHPNEVKTISFALAWDFPQVVFGDLNGLHTTWMKRYTAYFGAKETVTNDYIAGSYPFHQGFTLASSALNDEDTALKAVANWWDRIANEPAYPLWLRQAALNELYFDAFGSSFWEAGLVENTLPLKAGDTRVGAQIPGTHLFFNIETPIYRFAESYDVRAYDNRQWLLLFPDIERDVQRAWTEMILKDPAGHAPHDAGLIDLSPYIVWDGDTYNNPKNWLDLPIKYLFQVWEYMHFSGDKEFLRYAYPAMLHSYQFVALRIPQGQALPLDNGIDNTYDSWGLHGITSYVGGLWILGQEVMQAATQQALTMGIKDASPTLLAQLSANLPKSRAAFEQALWDPQHNYYRISTQDREYGDGVMADAMFAQHVAEVLNLPDIVSNPDHLHSHLLTSYSYLVTPWHDTQGHPLGAANGVNSDKSEIQTGQNEAQEVWTGVSYFYAATQYQDGQRFHDATMLKNALDTASGIAQQTYTVADNGYTFNTPEAWMITNTQSYRALEYMRARAIWELLLAIKQPLSWHTFASTLPAGA